MGFSLAFIAALYFCVIEGAGATIFKIHNKCPFTVWPARTELKGIQLDSGGSFQPTANLTRGTFWGRTGCSFGGSCTTGDCGAALNCEEGKGHFPATAFEYSLNQFQNQDFYDISVAGAFNLPMSIIPSNPNCKAITCSSNITANCPAELRVTGACMSACATFNTSQYCCTGNHSTTCSPSNYSRFFKAQCPQAYSYALDDATSTFTCPSGGNYTIVFCGAATSSLSPAPSATSVTHPSVAKRNNLVLGITISGALIMALSMMVAIAVYWKKFRTKQDHNEDYLTIMVPNSTKSRAFTLREIMESTQNFNHKIGQGGFGSVFFGKLREGRDIAVKVLSLLSIEGVHQFQNEVDLLSTIHHKNLVSLLGFCNEAKKVMLIYEHMSEGSLRDHLYGLRAENSPLDWKTRLKIALDAAQGLEYLHMGCTPKIIHRDVKTANILLDRNMNGKLADFGLSRITLDGEASYANTAVKGTIGYLDPEYFRTQMLTEKSDVYSFGVVLLEMICGRPPINANLCEEELNLIQWVTPYVKMDENAGDIEIIIDKRLDGNYNIISITKVAKLAFRCLEAKPSSRPSVSEVATQIKEAIMHENENNIPLPVSEGIGIEHRDSQASSAHSRLESIPRKMEWSDNSSNLPQVGR